MNREIKELTKELRRLQIKNLKLKLHIDIITSHPKSSTAQKLVREYQEADMRDSIVHLN